MSVPIRPDRCLESQGISKGFWGSPFMCCFCLCKNRKLCCLLGLGGFPQSSKTSNQLPESHLLGGDGMREGQVQGWGLFLKVVHLPQIQVFVEGEENEEAQLKWCKTLAASLIVYEVCFTLLNLKKRKRKVSMLPFPPLLNPPGLRRKSEGQKKEGSITHFNASHCCLLCNTILLFIKGKSQWRILNTGYIGSLNSCFKLKHQIFGPCSMGFKTPYFAIRMTVTARSDLVNLPQALVGLDSSNPNHFHTKALFLYQDS